MFRKVFYDSHFMIGGNLFGRNKHEARGTLGLAVSLIFPVLLVLAIGDRSTAIGGFILEQELPVGGTAVAIGEREIPGEGIVERIVVGVPTEEDEKGAVYIYRYDSGTMTWTKEQMLIALDGNGKGDRILGDNFGANVAIDGDRIVVAAPGDDDIRGSAYVFECDWNFPEPSGPCSEAQKITASDGESHDAFGYSIDIAGDRIAVGAIGYDDTASRSGAVYVYEPDEGVMPTQWVEKKILTIADALEETMLGWSVALEGDRIVAGAIQSNASGFLPPRTGAAYLFNGTSGNWDLEAELSPDVPSECDSSIPRDFFGYSISISGDRIAVGANAGSSPCSPGPYSYVFRLNDETMQWEKEKLENIGPNVTISGDQLVAGGALHLFGFEEGIGEWEEKQTLPAFAIDFSPARPLAFSGDLIAVTAPGFTSIFRFSPDSDGDGVPDEEDECPNSDLRSTVIIESCDSGVTNEVLTEPAGCTITDEILKLTDDANSHGQFVSQVDKFLLELQKAELLESNEKNAIKDCASQSSLP